MYFSNVNVKKKKIFFFQLVKYKCIKCLLAETINLTKTTNLCHKNKNISFYHLLYVSICNLHYLGSHKFSIKFKLMILSKYCMRDARGTINLITTNLYFSYDMGSMKNNFNHIIILYYS